MTFGERLIELRVSNGYSKRNEFADKLGIPSTTLRNYETGVREPGHTFLKRISELFNVSIDYLLGLTDEKEVLNSFRLKTDEYEYIKKYRSLDEHGKETINMIMERESQRTTTLKDLRNQFLDQSDYITKSEKLSRAKYFISYYQRMASAGRGEYLFEDIPTDLIEVVDTPIARRADFVIGVNGRSMEPDYYDGDKVFVEKSEEIPTGSIGLFLRGNDCFIKELGVDKLISHNANKELYPDIPGDEDIRCIGLVLGRAEEV